MMRYGIAEDEAREKRSKEGGLDWRKPRLISIAKTAKGTIVLASVPQGKGNDLMMGSRLEIWLFPDGTFGANINGTWLVSHSQQEGRPGAGSSKDGCRHYPTCGTCPFPDCIAKEYECV